MDKKLRVGVLGEQVLLASDLLPYYMTILISTFLLSLPVKNQPERVMMRP